MMVGLGQPTQFLLTACESDSMITAEPDWWNPHIVVGLGARRWTVVPEIPPNGALDRILRPPWNGVWAIWEGDSVEGRRIGSIGESKALAEELTLELRGDRAAVPHRGSSNEFRWGGHVWRFPTRFLDRVERDGVSVAVFRWRGTSIIVRDYPVDLAEPIAALAAALCLVHLNDIGRYGGGAGTAGV